MSNPAPQFRPRRSRHPVDRRRQWLRYGLLTGLGALIVALAAVLIVMAAAGGGDGDVPGEPGETPVRRSTAGSADGREPLSSGVVQYVVQLEDVVPGFQTQPGETYGISTDGFASGPYFATFSAGETAAKEWGYVEGYQALLEPIGKSADVALGKHYIRSEVYRFATAAGAHEAYGYLERFHAQFGNSVAVATKPLGNESSAFTMVQGTVPGTDHPGTYHRFIGRRGNLVYITQVFGAQQYVSIDQARDYAAIIDMKILGELPAPLPTPTPRNPGVGAAPTVESTPTP
jgi:hypothetical protein